MITVTYPEWLPAILLGILAFKVLAGTVGSFLSYLLKREIAQADLKRQELLDQREGLV